MAQIQARSGRSPRASCMQARSSKRDRKAAKAVPKVLLHELNNINVSDNRKYPQIDEQETKLRVECRPG